MGKLKNLFMAGVMATAMGHATKADAQTADKTKAKTTHVVNQSPEFWLNSTNGDRMLVTKNDVGGVDIQTTAGLGWRVNRVGNVTSLGDIGCTPEDIMVANSVASVLTGSTIHKNKGCKQRDGNSAIRNSGDGLTFFVTSHVSKNGKKERTAWFLGEAGYPDLHGPRGNEVSWEEAKKLSSIEEENKNLADMYVDVLRPAIDITKQTPDEMGFISEQSEQFVAQNYLGQNGQEL